MTDVSISLNFRDEPEIKELLSKLDELATRLKAEDISQTDAAYEIRTLLQPWVEDDGFPKDYDPRDAPPAE